MNLYKLNSLTFTALKNGGIKTVEFADLFVSQSKLNILVKPLRTLSMPSAFNDYTTSFDADGAFGFYIRFLAKFVILTALSNVYANEIDKLVVLVVFSNSFLSCNLLGNEAAQFASA